MTVASGTRRGSALSTPSTSVQITISDASSSDPKIDPEKSLPLRPRVVWRPSRVRALKPVTTSVAVGARARFRPEDARAEWRLVDLHDLPRVDPVHLAGTLAPLLEVAGEEAGR